MKITRETVIMGVENSLDKRLLKRIKGYEAFTFKDEFGDSYYETSLPGLIDYFIEEYRENYCFEYDKGEIEDNYEMLEICDKEYHDKQCSYDKVLKSLVSLFEEGSFRKAKR